MENWCRKNLTITWINKLCRICSIPKSDKTMWVGSVLTLWGLLAACVLFLDTNRLRPITQRFTGKGDMLALVLKGILKIKRVRNRSLEEKVKVHITRMMGKYLNNEALTILRRLDQKWFLEFGAPPAIYQAHNAWAYSPYHMQPYGKYPAVAQGYPAPPSVLPPQQASDTESFLHWVAIFTWSLKELLPHQGLVTDWPPPCYLPLCLFKKTT